jgi:large subunit ribosomal protein L29
MKADKLRDVDAKELETQSREAEAQLFHLRLQMGMGQLEGLKKYRALRKDRARMLTLLRERQAAQAVKKG